MRALKNFLIVVDMCTKIKPSKFSSPAFQRKFRLRNLPILQYYCDKQNFYYHDNGKYHSLYTIPNTDIRTCMVVYKVIMEPEKSIHIIYSLVFIIRRYHC